MATKKSNIVRFLLALILTTTVLTIALFTTAFAAETVETVETATLPEIIETATLPETTVAPTTAQYAAASSAEGGKELKLIFVDTNSWAPLCEAPAYNVRPGTSFRLPMPAELKGAMPVSTFGWSRAKMESPTFEDGIISGIMPEDDARVVLVCQLYGAQDPQPPVTHQLTVTYFTEGDETPWNTMSVYLEEGETYYFPTTTREGYTASEAIVSGVMGEEDVSVSVIYVPNVYTLKVEMIIDGSEVPFDTVTRTVKYGEEYRVDAAASPLVAYVSSTPSVTGAMPAHDVTRTIIFVRKSADPQYRILTIQAVAQRPGEALDVLLDMRTTSVEVGTEYSAEAWPITGYELAEGEEDILTGIMPDEDITLVFLYREVQEEPLYVLTVRCVRAADEEEDIPEITLKVLTFTFYAGEHYTVEAPVIECNTPRASELTGTMPPFDATVELYYDFHGPSGDNDADGPGDYQPDLQYIDLPVYLDLVSEAT